MAVQPPLPALFIDAALRLHALGMLADHLADTADFARAITAATALLAIDRYHEGAVATLIRVNLLQGMETQARNIAERYAGLLTRELGVAMPPSFVQLREIPSSARTVAIPVIADPELEPTIATSSIVRKAHPVRAGEQTAEFEVVATGLSMEPTIRHGDTLVYSKDIDASPGRIAVAIHDGSWIVKRIALRDGQLMLRSDNADEELTFDEVQLVGVVVELRRMI